MNIRSSIIFHCPFPVSADRVFSANAVRPLKILQTFRKLGFEVAEITGYAAERRQRIEETMRRIRQGETFDFAYSESSNLPLFFNEPDRIPRHPFIDNAFLKKLRYNGVPIGLFYRDLHWRSPSFRKYSIIKRIAATPFYWLDWIEGVCKTDHLFLPSLRMAEFLPTSWPSGRISALPPGCDLDIMVKHGNATAARKRKKRGLLELFYVGGITPPLYDLTPAFRLARDHQAKLTVCCRVDEWQKVRSYYSEYISGHVEIIHEQGDSLAQYYDLTDLFIMALSSFSYLDFAVPYKLFESVSYAVPILSFGENEATRTVQREGFGWTARSYDELSETLRLLDDNRDLIREKRLSLVDAAQRHSWENRVLAIQAALTGRRDVSR